MPEKPGVAGVQELRNETAAFRSVDLASGRFEASICSRLGYLHPEPCNFSENAKVRRAPFLLKFLRALARGVLLTSSLVRFAGWRADDSCFDLK